jgi:hypothetical protein
MAPTGKETHVMERPHNREFPRNLGEERFKVEHVGQGVQVDHVTGREL